MQAGQHAHANQVGEPILGQWLKARLTPWRVFTEVDSGGAYEFNSICLDRVEYVGVSRTHHPVLLWLAGFLVIVAVLFPNEVSWLHTLVVWTLVALALVFAVGYLVAREVEFVVACASHPIRIKVQGGPAERAQAVAFAKQVQLQALRSRSQLR